MANEKYLAVLKQGFDVWNEWREENSDIRPDLRGADLRKAQLSSFHLADVDLSGANLTGAELSGAYLNETWLSNANLRGTNLSRALLSDANLSEANLSQADLSQAWLPRADFSGADLREANLNRAELFDANLSGANLSGADARAANLRGTDLQGAILIGTDLHGAFLNRSELGMADLSQADIHGADLRGVILEGTSLIKTVVESAKISGSRTYGVGVWDLVGEFEEQKELVIMPDGDAHITVDNIKVAQFIYLILHNQEIRDVINTLTSKSVLILGRFSIPKRKAILDALRNKLREHNLLPIVFDFDRPVDKDFTETIKTLAGLCLFVIADITNPKSSPLELQATVPDYQIPFVPIIQEGEQPFSMMVDLQKKYNWVLPTRSYDSIDTLMKALKPGIIDPAIKMHAELQLIKAREQVVHPLKDFIDK